MVCLVLMIPRPAEILTSINIGTLLSRRALSELDHDAILNERDGNADFEARWKRCYNEIVDSWPAEDSKYAQLIEDIRRTAFLSVSRATAQHEIASYVSDDFDIIVRGSIIGLNDEFLNSLWDSYKDNKIPRSLTSK